MRATCGKCGEKAEVSLKARSGFSYDMLRPAIAYCPVVKERAQKNGGSTSEIDCDHMAKASQVVAEKMRGKR